MSLPTSGDGEQGSSFTYRFAHGRWFRPLARLAVTLAVLWVAARIPLPLLENWLPVKDVVFAVLTVGALGKWLYDTLFYDRYW